MNEIDSLLVSAIDRGLFPGAALVLYNGSAKPRVVCQGTIKFGGDEPVHSGVRFDLASVTKVHTFLAVLVLIDTGRLKFEDLLAKFLPFKVEGDIQRMTVWHMLTCGLDFIVPQHLQGDKLNVRDSTGELLFFKVATLAGPLDTMFRYGNFSAFIAGKLVEVVTGLSLPDALQELVFGPLEMHDTSFGVNPATLNRVAPTQDVVTGLWTNHGEVQDPMSRAFGSERVGIAGLFSSIRSLGNLPWFLASGQTPDGREFLSPKLWRMMVSDQLVGRTFSDGIVRQYCLGIDKAPWDYVKDEVFPKKGVLMSGTSGPYIGACPSWYRGNLSRRPVAWAFLTNAYRDVADWKAWSLIHRDFRRALTQACLDVCA